MAILDQIVHSLIRDNLWSTAKVLKSSIEQHTSYLVYWLNGQLVN